MLGLEYFTFADKWSPLFLAFMLVLTAVYFLIVGPLSSRFEGSAPVSAGRKVLFVSGMAAYYLAQGGPIELLGHMMFSFHMISMALSYLVAVPLIILGIPVWLWRAFDRVNPFRKLGFLARPIVSAVVFNGLFSFYHIPVVHDFVMLNFTVHRIYFLILFITSMLMWWAILNPIPEKDKSSGLMKMAYIFLNMVLLTPACALIIFSSHPMYATFSDPAVWAKAMGYCVSDTSTLLTSFSGPQDFGYLDPLIDQRVGGIIMKFFQEIIFASMLAYVFFHWYKRENKEDDPLPGDIPPGNLNQA
ncbi:MULTISPECIES: cytochrome c oxidase assembly factor CtaG [Paenibacillus]|uniref:Cytochrome c oxidase assembly factor CtaG n=1 Tax=Paenibacillus campinasensis TaxID=66347 RepID=A0A268EQS5_9BACL|nr:MULTISPECIES: cytochrome c oxidase assembly factor CtaG [Paenibacillus]MUG65459.1 cytochrome c oxidase assembly factor CtaG [Paenibacillus campinasensis]PAD75464.1 cytochrome c oxidase assembly factor CtaG [Paenibacillus campinasensis]PAK51450.1 cytochrome c oxidase assembly factor CtaG [Paenibacillus sp. 7541]